MGAFIGSLLNNKSLRNSVEFASAAAAIVVKKVGCSEAMHYYEEIENFIKDNNITM